jgi:hypothetical protein
MCACCRIVKWACIRTLNSLARTCFSPIIPFPCSLSSCRDIGTLSPVWPKYWLQNSSASSIDHPSAMHPSGMYLFQTYFLRTLIDRSKGNIWCKKIGTSCCIWWTRWTTRCMDISKNIGGKCISSRVSVWIRLSCSFLSSIGSMNLCEITLKNE